MGWATIPSTGNAGENRLFHYAVLLSIVLHGLALFAFPQLRLATALPASPGLIVARLAAPAAAPRAEEPKDEKLKEEQPKEEKREQPRRERSKSAPLKKAAPRAQAEPAPAEPPAEPAAPPSVEPAPSVEPGTSAGTSAEVGTSAIARAEPQPAAPSFPVPAAPVLGPDPGALGRYRMEIISLARQFKRYPPLARENNWMGRAEVRLSFDAEGRRTSVSIVRSSGYPVLDRQAIDTMTRAAVPVPPVLRGRPFALEIPMIFNLDEEGA